MGVDFRSKNSGMRRLAGAIGRFAIVRSRLTLGLLMLATVALAPFAATIHYDDDVLQFLPEGDPEVVRFQEMGQRFGGLSIAIVGIEAPTGDLFTVERLRLIRTLSQTLSGIDGIAHTTSITELRDIAEEATGDGEAMTIVSDLVGVLPDSSGAPGAADAMVDLRTRVLSRDHITGSLISPAADATILLCHIAPGHAVKPIADAIRENTQKLAKEQETGLKFHFGGAPFIGSFVADGARADILRLSPYVCLAIVIIVFASVRSFWGTLIALGSVLMGIVWVIGMMNLMGQSLTLVSSSLPVLLVALGSAYSIHLLVRVLAHLDRGVEDRPTAVQLALDGVGPPVLLAGITTALGFLSFLVMDIGPMRDFGLAMAIGTLMIVLLTLWVVPAACVLCPLRPQKEDRAPKSAVRLLQAVPRSIIRHPRGALVVGLAVVGISTFYATRVDTHMETRRFFEDDSEPVQAEDFLENRLGGSLFLQVEVAGDIRNPLVLRQIHRLSTMISAQNGVTDVQSISTVMTLASKALTGDKRLPSSPQTTAALSRLVEEDPNIRLLVDPDWTHALLQVRLGGFDTRKASALASMLAKQTAHLSGDFVAVPRETMTDTQLAAEQEQAAEMLGWLLVAAGYPTASKEAVGSLLGTKAAAADPRTTAAAVLAQLNRDLVEDELVYLTDDADISKLSNDIAKLLIDGKLTADTLLPLLSEIATEEEKENPDGLRKAADFIAKNLQSIQHDTTAAAQSAALIQLLGKNPQPGVQEQVLAVLAELRDPYAVLPRSRVGDIGTHDIRSIHSTIGGYPMIYVGMNQSVQRNQAFSLIVSFFLIVAALAWFFQSILLALIASVPAALTLLIVFAIMGAMNIPMDVGTSMISSIALGTGIDYAVHLLWRHGVHSGSAADAALSESLSATGWGIVVNALEVAAGFGLMILGTIVPMRNFGLLTATAMVVSAVVTLAILLPLVRAAADMVLKKHAGYTETAQERIQQ